MAELTEEQKKEKAERLEDVITKSCESAVESYEDFLKENPNATDEEKHDMLVERMKANFMLTTLLVHALK